MPPFTHRGRVAFHETDAAGVVHFATYFLYAEEAETAALASLGIFSADALARYGFPRVQAEAEYRRPLRFHEAYEVRAALLHIGSSSLHWQFDIAGEAGPCACLRLVSARRDAATGEAAPYSETERGQLQSLLLPAEKQAAE